MDRKTLLAMTLCLLIYVGWQKLYIEPYYRTIPTAEHAAPAQNRVVVPPPSSQRALSPSVPQSQKEFQKLIFQTKLGTVELGNGAQAITGWDLKNYRQGIENSAPLVDLQYVTHQDGQLSLAFEDPQFTYLNDIRGSLVRTASGALWNYEDEKIKLSREIRISENDSAIDITVNATFKVSPAKYAFISLSGQGVDGDPEAQDRQLLYWSKESLERVLLKDVIQKEITSPISYIGSTNRYFLMAILASNNMSATGLLQPTGQKESGRLSLVYPLQSNTFSIPLKVYFGPKDLDVLRMVDTKLDHTVDFGWFTAFAYPILKVLKWLYQFFKNYGVAIIVLTVLLKVVTYPLTYKSMQSMKKMSKLQPQLQRLRDRYKDDKETLNREMMVMMKKHGYNPMAGCLPIVLQMPIFFALYRVLYSSIELYHAPFAFWIKDLSTRDPFYVTPILLAATMFIQQKLTPNPAADPAQAKMQQFIPLIMGAFMLTLPSGLTIYMLVNAIASIVQQMILNKKFDAAPAR